MEAAHHRREAFGDHLEGEVAAARILIRLYAGQPDQQLDAVLARLFFNRGDRLGLTMPSQISSQITVSRRTLRSTA